MNRYEVRIHYTFKFPVSENKKDETRIMHSKVYATDKAQARNMCMADINSVEVTKVIVEQIDA